MDIEKFERLVHDPAKTQAELEQMAENARRKGLVEFEKIANEVLQERFPSRSKRSGGRTPTIATFRSQSEDFDTGKDGYIWLVNQICNSFPDALKRYCCMHGANRVGSAGSKGARFAKNSHELFPVGSNRRGNSAYCATLANGWYADVNLSNLAKFETLQQLGAVCGLEFGKDWNYQVSGATEQLVIAQKSGLHS